jgi:predicted transcriptional regulator
MDPDGLANALKVLSTERRIRLFRYLIRQTKPQMVSNIATYLGFDEKVVSYNLNEMAKVGLVLSTQTGRYRFYGINRPLIAMIAHEFRGPGEEEWSLSSS